MIPTILIASLIAVLFVVIVVSEIRNVKKGKGSCGCSCSTCAMNCPGRSQVYKVTTKKTPETTISSPAE